uniref:Retrovirus-related Pol polyprotein LINE-1 n=1 Tax=Cajanus cajan TaxID=3821 RepID=A0A151QYY8_CAJCA|nr:Retrovirus-related Pol polyprotein LINE-1 [Cajanus cajan]
MLFINDFHSNGRLVRGLNSSFIALVSKKDCPERIEEFRPISLIGCLYKVLSKILANRLRMVISSVISDCQSAFIKGRQILDSVLVANEAVEEVKRKKSKCIMFKVDFEKAYDSVSWSCLQFVMGKMGFPTIWCTWIAECLKTSRTSVLVNGSPTEEFGVSKGLRQGDPLAPFLFLIVAEGLFTLFNKASQLERFKGCLMGKDKVPVDILQYADDTLIMGHASHSNIWTIKSILRLFELASGLKVNFSKSTLMGYNVESQQLQIMASILHCRVGSTPFSYLGLPIGANHRMISTWHPVIEKVKKRLSRWKCTTLSFGGRIALLKSVLHSIPIYFLSFFKAPKGIISSIESLFKSSVTGSVF